MRTRREFFGLIGLAPAAILKHEPGPITTVELDRGVFEWVRNSPKEIELHAFDAFGNLVARGIVSEGDEYGLPSSLVWERDGRARRASLYMAQLDEPYAGFLAAPYRIHTEGWPEEGIEAKKGETVEVYWKGPEPKPEPTDFPNAWSTNTVTLKSNLPTVTVTIVTKDGTVVEEIQHILGRRRKRSV